MFGESESESPRTGSPWDTLLSEPKSPLAVDDSPAKQQANNVPKLAPEVEQGNVEYKLKLVNPSKERFDRLVTQLKWRLLEGGGQAFYELGVADSGQLVGLPRLHLEQSLQTLEEMAGEIGASVIVVKEIELPPALVDLADKSQIKPDGAMRMPKKRMEDNASEILTENECTNTEEETELSTPEPEEDLDTDDSKSPVIDGAKVVSSLTIRSHPDRPTAQSSPTVSPVEDNDDLLDAGDETDLSDYRSTIDLEIFSVYKPRPTRRRAAEVTRQLHGKAGPQASSSSPASKAENKRKQRQDNKCTKQNHKSKDRKKSAKNTVEDTNIPKVVVEGVNDDPSTNTGSIHIEDSVAALVPSQALHVRVEKDEVVVGTTLDDSASKTTVTQEEGRFIVEVLVVKKMAVEEAFLDFGVFDVEFLSSR